MLLTLVACNQVDKGAPTVSVTSPASGQPLSGTVGVQLSAQDDSGVAKISVYARAHGATNKGVLIGSATQAPYVVSWFTPQYPNASDLEVYAVALDTSGNSGESDPVRVKIQNPGSPVLSYLAGFNLPPDTRVAASSVDSHDGLDTAVIQALNVDTVKPPAGMQPQSQPPRSPRAATSALRPLADDSGRTLAVEWGWPTYPGADGYGIFLGKTDLAGPYTRMRNQAAATSGTQKFSKKITSEEAKGPLLGVVTAITQNQTVETGLSNADDARFMTIAQQSASPADGQILLDGKPVLTWNANSEAVGYLYYVFDKNPFDATAKILWTNAPQTTDKLSATYPATAAPLNAGTYYWWVAGVGFNQNGQADAFSFSAPRTFVVPAQ
ncbi:Ig-like domain-containing protein [Deinococcus peraridilitoris]|nr:Ig-like domain-containing protein [Deinococcus peraridilitoris]